MTTATLPAPAPVPALARRSSPAAAVANSFTLAWRSVLKIKTNPEDLFGPVAGEGEEHLVKARPAQRELGELDRPVLERADDVR